MMSKFALGLILLPLLFQAKEIFRDYANVMVNNRREVWELRWQKKPHAVRGCWYDQIDLAFTCPCTGVAYAEAGPLSLVRTKDGQEFERLDLAPPFQAAGDFAYSTSQGEAAIIKLSTSPDDITENTLAQVKKIQKRKVRKILNMVDLDHDGQKTEFLLSVGSAPCGKVQQVAVGISKQNSSLHFFASTTKPQQALSLASYEWEALLKGKDKVTVIDWRCADHGAIQQIERELSFVDGKIKGKQFEYRCDSDSKKTELLKSLDL